MGGGWWSVASDQWLARSGSDGGLGRGRAVGIWEGLWGFTRIVYTMSTDVVKWLGVGSGGGVAVDGGAAAAVAPGAVAGRDRAAADVPAQSGERGAAHHGELAVPGVDPGVWELAVARGAGGSADLGAADGRGQSGDEGVVLLGV